MRLQVLELDHVSEINQEVAAEVCREGLKGLEMLVLSSTPVTPKALLHFNSKFIKSLNKQRCTSISLFLSVLLKNSNLKVERLLFVKLLSFFALYILTPCKSFFFEVTMHLKSFKFQQVFVGTLNLLWFRLESRITLRIPTAQRRENSLMRWLTSCR